MLIHPIPDRHHCRLGTRDLAALDEQPPDRHVRLPVLPVVADPDCLAITQPDPARALDLQKKRVDRIVDPQKFEPTPGECSILDLGPGIAGSEPEIGRAPVDRRLITPPAPPGPVQFDLVVSGEQPFAGAIISNRKRDEGRLEEAACRGGVRRRQPLGGLTQPAPDTYPSVIRDTRACVEWRGIRQRQEPSTGFEKGRDRCRKPIIGPPLKLGEGDGLKRKPCWTRVAAQARHQKRQNRERRNAPKALPSETRRAFNRCWLRRGPSSDRWIGYRAQRSSNRSSRPAARERRRRYFHPSRASH